MAETHRKRSKIPAVDAWIAAYDIASSAVLTPEQEYTFKALLPRLKHLDSVPDELIGDQRCPLLQQAAGKGHLRLMRLLLEAGANINYRFHSYKFTALRAPCRFALVDAVNALIEAGGNINAEDIGQVPINHAIYSGSVQMVETLLARNVSLSLPEILQDAVTQCQNRERELSSFRASGQVPKQIAEIQKREALKNGTAGAPASVGGMEAPAASMKFGTASNSAAVSSAATAPTAGSATESGSTMSASSIEKILSDDLENRFQIVCTLLRANIRIPYSSRPVWLPYLITHTAFKGTIDSIASAAAHTFDRIRALEFANLTTVSLRGECIDDAKAATIAKVMIAPATGNSLLMHLDLSRNWIEQKGAADIGTALARNTTLQTLNLAHNFIQDCTAMMRGMKDNKTLKGLDLSANRLSTIAGDAIAMRLPTMRLTALNLSMNKLEHRGGLQVLRAVLCNVNIANNEPEDTLAFNSSGRNLASPLSFATTGSGSSTPHHSASSASSSPTSTRDPSPGSSKDGANAINGPRRTGSSGALADNSPLSTLTSLNLSSNEIHPYEKLLFSDELVERLATNTVLTELDLSYNWFSTQDIVRLVRSLNHNVKMATLSVRGYCFSEDDLKQFHAALSVNFTLSKMDFDHSPTSDVCNAIRRHVLKNSISFSNSHLVHDPIVPDISEPSDSESGSQRSESPSRNTRDSSESVGDSSTSTATNTMDTRTSLESDGGGGSSSAVDRTSTDKPRSVPNSTNSNQSSSSSGRAPTALKSLSKVDRSSSTSQLSPHDTCPTETKQYGIVRQGDDRSDVADMKSLWPTPESANPPHVPPSQVTEVHAGGRDLRCFPRCILGYEFITKLVVQRNSLNSLPRAIGCLKNLVLLDVRGNRLPALPPEIGDLAQLSFLLASHNKLQFVPMQLTRQASLKYVVLDPNPLTLVPPNFRKGLSQLHKKPFQQSELYQYLKTIGACGEDTFNKGRLMLVGDPAVGKTTIRKMLVKGKTGFNLFEWLHGKTATQEVSVATDGIDIDVVRMSDKDGKRYTFDVWDYAGHEVYYTTHTFFLSPRAVYLLVFNMENYSRLSIEYWMQSIVFKAGSMAPIFLVGTHAESLSPTERTNLLAQLKKNYRGVFVDLVWINPVTGEGVEDLKLKICKIASQRKLVGERVPKSYMRIADQLLATAQTRPYMPLKEIGGIVLSNDVPAESADAAISWLIDIGSILSYSANRAPDQLVFIDPQFLCNTFSQVVSIKYSSTTGRLTRGVIASICAQDPKLQAELFRILRQFDLAYVLKRAQDDVKFETAQGEKDVELFVPALLADSEPSDVSKLWRPEPTMRVYQRHFTFLFLPLGFFSKLLVRCLLLPGVEPLVYWANGIVARKGKESFFIRFEPDKNLLVLQANTDQDGMTLALLVELIVGLIKERYSGANYTTTIPVSTSAYETLYLDVDELASNIASGQYVRVVDGKVWNISMYAPDLVLRDLASLRINDTDLVKGKRLGVGSFGEVFEATYRGEACAVKYITKFRDLPDESDMFHYRADEFASFAHEIRVMNLLKHPNIVCLKGFIPRPVGLLMELFECGDMVGLLEKSPDAPWPLRVRIALDIALGMEYLHMLEPPLCHRDLRSPNILLKSREPDSSEPVAKVADFGLTVAVVDRLGYEPTESWRWSAPEVVTANKYTHRSDIWSFGILLLELIYAELPYASLEKSLKKRDDEMSRLYAAGAFRPEFPSSFSDHQVPPANEQEHEALKMFAQLGRDCCSESPDDRPSFTEIVPHLYDIIESMGTLELPDTIRYAAQHTMLDEQGEDADAQTQQDAPSPSSSAASSSATSASRPAQTNPMAHHTAQTSKITGYHLDESAKVTLSSRKHPAQLMTTSVRVVNETIWVGLADGTLGVWDASKLAHATGTESTDGTQTTIDLQLIKTVGDHTFSIRGIVVNDAKTKLCAISEDGFFTLVNLADFSCKKFQASPGHTSPLLSVTSVGERIYIGTARGHVVAWSWDPPTLLAFWDGMDKQPVCQLFYARGIKDLSVTYGQTIKFLNVFDLGDSLRHWRPQMKKQGELLHGNSTSSLARHPNAVPVSSAPSSPSSSQSAASQVDHKRLAQSTKAVANTELFDYVSACQSAAYIAEAGHYIWSKSGPYLRLWTPQSMSSKNSEPAEADPSSLIGLSAKEQQKMLQQQANKMRTAGFDQTLVLAKELVSPNLEACYSNLVAPTILNMGTFVFVLESPNHITLWNSAQTSFVDTLQQPSEKPCFENIVTFGDSLIAFARDRLFVYRPTVRAAADSHLTSIRASTSSLALGSSTTIPLSASSTIISHAMPAQAASASAAAISSPSPSSLEASTASTTSGTAPSALGPH